MPKHRATVGSYRGDVFNEQGTPEVGRGVGGRGDGGCVGVESFGLRGVEGSRFRVQVLGFRIQCLRFKV